MSRLGALPGETGAGVPAATATHTLGEPSRQMPGPRCGNSFSHCPGGRRSRKRPILLLLGANVWSADSGRLLSPRRAHTPPWEATS